MIAILAGALLAPAAASAGDTAAWYDRVEFAGDFRLRYESISEEQSADRERGRFRGRFGLTAQAADDIQLVFRFATGDGSPVSTNLSFDDGFSAKDLHVDRAFVDWRLNDVWHVYGGKMKSPWFRSGGNALLWDSDLNPEGVAASFTSTRLFGSFAVLQVSERAAADDSLLLTAQGGVKRQFGEAGTLRLGAGLYEYTDTLGNTPFYDGSPRGNSVDGAGNYAYDYSLLEVFAEYRTVLAGWPLTVFAERVENTAVDVQDTAFLAGAKLGEARAPGSFEFAWSWQDTEADAVIGTFNDSDFAGGNTDARGHLLTAAYALHDNVTLGATLILAERGAFAGNERDYDRFMLDIEFSFE